jgi:hypothetical protein
LQLLDLFLRRHPDFFALVLGCTDMQLDVGDYGERVIPAYGLPIATSATLVGGSDLFVGIDSSMLHAADLFRVPGVGIFGSTSPHEWGFKFSPHRHVYASGKMSMLREGAVLEALEDLLAETDALPIRSNWDILEGVK